MLCLVWFLVAAEVLGTSFEPAVWEAHLKAIDSSLPTTVVEDYKVCYYFDLAQTCASSAIGTLLHQAPVTNVLTWTPTAADCSKLLEKQRPSLEEAAINLFGKAITSSATAGVTNFELLAQSWVLRVGHHALSVKQEVLVAAINSISDWKTVHCDGTNLLYDGKSIPKPDFVGAVDCDILDTVHADTCASGSCTLAEGTTCCGSNKSSACCQAHLSTVQSECSSNASCAHKSTCCSLDSASVCCTGVDPCGNASCTIDQAFTCCPIDTHNACCAAKLSEIQNVCLPNPQCENKSGCCAVYPSSQCCLGANCDTMYCGLEDGKKCCVAGSTNSQCCNRRRTEVLEGCNSQLDCGYSATCCNLDQASLCCNQMPPVCGQASCTIEEAVTCYTDYKSAACFQAQQSAILDACHSHDNCPYKSTCCALNPVSYCCTGSDPCNTNDCPGGQDTMLLCCQRNSESGCCRAFLPQCSTSNCGGYLNFCCTYGNDSYNCCRDR